MTHRTIRFGTSPSRLGISLSQHGTRHLAVQVTNPARLDEHMCISGGVDPTGASTKLRELTNPEPGIPSAVFCDVILLRYIVLGLCPGHILLPMYLLTYLGRYEQTSYVHCISK